MVTDANDEGLILDGRDLVAAGCMMGIACRASDDSAYFVREL